MNVLKSYKVSGRVQGVMFRQTLVRGALKRGLDAGATNLSTGEVNFSLGGEKSKVDDLMAFLRSGKELNSWKKAKVEGLEEIDFIPFESHQVSHQNVDAKNWTPGVEFYL